MKKTIYFAALAVMAVTVAPLVMATEPDDGVCEYTIGCTSDITTSIDGGYQINVLQLPMYDPEGSATLKGVAESSAVHETQTLKSFFSGDLEMTIAAERGLADYDAYFNAYTAVDNDLAGSTYTGGHFDLDGYSVGRNMSIENVLKVSAVALHQPGLAVANSQLDLQSATTVSAGSFGFEVNASALSGVDSK